MRAEREAEAQSRSVETEELQDRVTSVSQERDLLQGALEGLMQEREQQRAELEDGMEKLRAEVHYGRCGSKQPNSEAGNSSSVTPFIFLLSCYNQQVAVLSASLQAEAERKKQLEEELQHSRDAVRSSFMASGPAQLSQTFPFCIFTGFIFLLLKASGTQEILDLVQEELSEQKLMRSDLERRCRERQSSLDRQVGVSEG